MDGKRFLFVSLDEPLIADLAWQIHREGNDVRWSNYTSPRTAPEHRP